MSDSSTKSDEAIEKLRLQRAAKRLKSIQILSVTGIIGIALISLSGWLLTGNKIVITDEMKVFALTTIGTAIFTAPIVIAGINRIYKPDFVVVVEINLTKSMPIHLWSAAPDKWDDVDMVSGESKEFSFSGIPIYLVNRFTHVDDADTQFREKHVPDDASGWVAAGSWIGEANDAEMVHYRHEIKANRRRNNLWARVGEKLYSKFKTIARNSAARHHKQLEDQEMEMSTFDPGAVRDEAVSQVPELGDVDNGKTANQIIEDEINESITEENTGETGVKR